MKRFLLFIVFLAAATGASAQNVRVEFRIDSSSYLIGDWMQAHVRVSAPEEYRIVFPHDSEGFRNAEYVSEDSMFSEESGGQILYSKDYTLITFDTALVDIGVDIEYYKPGDTTAYVAASPDTRIEVRLVEIDTTETFKDIKEVLHVPTPWWVYALWIIGLAALAYLAWWLWKWNKRRMEEQPEPEPEPEPEEPPIPAHIWALEHLRSLEGRKVWEAGMHKEFQSELSEIIRGYIERKFEVKALEETSGEIIWEMRAKGVESQLIKELQTALECADLTKFAKYVPDAVAHRSGLKTAYYFVEQTKGWGMSAEEELAMERAQSQPEPEDDGAAEQEATQPAKPAEEADDVR
ncbi:MAG: hypothetical protein CL946_07620 [Ectothiorhodospiraceae bacterium]|nr:hypothetical protein [Ectothiorhodospiraceae bacterium]